MPDKRLNILIVEDDAVTRAGIVERVGAESRLRVVDAVGSLEAARGALRRSPVDVALIDLELEDGNGIELIREMYEQSPGIHVMVVSVFGDERSVIDAIEAGARGYLLKDDSAQRVAVAILQLAAGGSPISPSIAAHLIDRFVGHGDGGKRAEPDVALSDRELEVLTYASRGYTYAEVAELMGVSVNTVSSYTRRVYGKLAVTSRSQAVFEAQRLGLMKTPGRK